jgi:hypothetical protein
MQGQRVKRLADLGLLQPLVTGLEEGRPLEEVLQGYADNAQEHEVAVNKLALAFECLRTIWQQKAHQKLLNQLEQEQQQAQEAQEEQEEEEQVELPPLQPAVVALGEVRSSIAQLPGLMTTKLFNMVLAAGVPIPMRPQLEEGVLLEPSKWATLVDKDMAAAEEAAGQPPRTKQQRADLRQLLVAYMSRPALGSDAVKLGRFLMARADLLVPQVRA